MLAMEKDGQLQICAALSLLNNSRLVAWKAELAAFKPVDRDIFELSWRKDVDPDFGRLICWMSFAAGAEFFAKGVCLIRGVEIRTEQSVPMYPSESIKDWVPRFLKHPDEKGTMVSATDYGTLGDFTRNGMRNGVKMEAAFPRLFKVVNATATERDLLRAAYELLRKSIRNRDAHAYAPNVRDSHHNLVPQLFTESFNLLASWLPGGPSTLTQWQAEARTLIASL